MLLESESDNLPPLPSFSSCHPVRPHLADSSCNLERDPVPRILLPDPAQSLFSRIRTLLRSRRLHLRSIARDVRFRRIYEWICRCRSRSSETSFRPLPDRTFCQVIRSRSYLFVYRRSSGSSTSDSDRMVNPPFYTLPGGSGTRFSPVFPIAED